MGPRECPHIGRDAHDCVVVREEFNSRCWSGYRLDRFRRPAAGTEEERPRCNHHVSNGLTRGSDLKIRTIATTNVAIVRVPSVDFALA